MLQQRNLPEEVKVRRKSEYKAWKKRVRKLIEESKRRVNEEFGRKLSQNFNENKKLSWKEVNTKEYKGSTDSNSPVGPNEAVRATTHYNYTMSQRASTVKANN